MRGGRQKYKRRPEVENATYQSAPLPLTKESEKGGSRAETSAFSVSVFRHNAEQYDVLLNQIKSPLFDTRTKSEVVILLFKQLNKLLIIKKYDVSALVSYVQRQ